MLIEPGRLRSRSGEIQPLVELLALLHRHRTTSLPTGAGDHTAADDQADVRIHLRHTRPPVEVEAVDRVLRVYVVVRVAALHRVHTQEPASSRNIRTHTHLNHTTTRTCIRPTLMLPQPSRIHPTNHRVRHHTRQHLTKRTVHRRHTLLDPTAISSRDHITMQIRIRPHRTSRATRHANTTRQTNHLLHHHTRPIERHTRRITSTREPIPTRRSVATQSLRWDRALQVIGGRVRPT